MSYPDEVMRCSITWQPDEAEWPGEIAVNTFWLQHHHVPPREFSWDDTVGYTAGKIAEKLGSHWSDLGLFHGPGYGPKGVKCAHVDSAGHDLQVGISDPITDLTGAGSGSKVLPPEVALVIGLYGYVPGTFAAHKGRKRGRMYLPYLSPDALGADGKVGSSALTYFKTVWTDFFNDIQGMHTNGTEAESDWWNLVVVSTIGPGGSATQVNHIVVDNHFDSQRRRQHQSPATQEVGDISS